MKTTKTEKSQQLAVLFVHVNIYTDTQFILLPAGSIQRFESLVSPAIYYLVFSWFQFKLDNLVLLWFVTKLHGKFNPLLFWPNFSAVIERWWWLTLDFIRKCHNWVIRILHTKTPIMFVSSSAHTPKRWCVAIDALHQINSTLSVFLFAAGSLTFAHNRMQF